MVEVQLQRNVVSSHAQLCLCPAQLPLVTLEATWGAQFENHCFWHAVVIQTSHPAAYIQMRRKVVEKPQTSHRFEPLGTNSGSWLAFSWSYKVTRTGFGWDHQRKFLNWATLGSKSTRGTGVFMRWNFITRIHSLIMLYMGWINQGSNHVLCSLVVAIKA